MDRPQCGLCFTGPSLACCCTYGLVRKVSATVLARASALPLLQPAAVDAFAPDCPTACARLRPMTGLLFPLDYHIITADCSSDSDSSFPSLTYANNLSYMCTHTIRRWSRIRGDIGCKKRRHFMTKSRYNFFSNEYVMHDTPANRSTVASEEDEMLPPSPPLSPPDFAQTMSTTVRPCHEFSSVLVLRHPHKRVASHVSHILQVR